MSALTDKYGSLYILAEQLGGTGLAANEDNGHMTISGTLPTKYDVNQVWDKAKEIDPGLDDGDLTLNLSAPRSNIYVNMKFSQAIPCPRLPSTLRMVSSI